jgi:CheY-like chemotaxis protein
MASVATPGGSAHAESGAVILVVDDNAAKRLSIVSILEGLGH